MGQQLRPWRSGDGERRWLSALVDTMEVISRRDARVAPCDRRILAALRAQLARPASPYAMGTSRFSLRN
jgi:hypothetical protein